MVTWRRSVPAVAAVVVLFMIAGAAAEGRPEAAPPALELRSLPAAECAHADGVEALPLGGGGPPGFEGCLGFIRPGARMTAPNGCTLNFIFEQGSDLFVGTAGHCVSGTGQRVGANGVGLFGTVVYHRFDGTLDFALIRIDADKHASVDPRMCTWGGPTGVGTPGGTLTTEPLLEYGWGVATQFTPQTRSRVHDEFLSSSDVLRWNGVGSGGDSGAPVLSASGLAVGIHTAGLTPVAGVVWEQGPTVTHILSSLEGAGWNVQLVPGGPGGL